MAIKLIGIRISGIRNAIEILIGMD